MFLHRLSPLVAAAAAALVAVADTEHLTWDTKTLLPLVGRTVVEVDSSMLVSVQTEYCLVELDTAEAVLVGLPCTEHLIRTSLALTRTIIQLLAPDERSSF